MARKKKEDAALAVVAEILGDMLNPEEKEVMMRSAQIKGTDCHYSFEALQSNKEKGYHKGVVYPVKTKDTIIKESFRDTIREGRVHLACLDDAFLLSQIDFNNLALVKNEDLVDDYAVLGIQLKGNEGDLKVIITGKKFSKTAKEWIEFDVPVVLEEYGDYVHREFLKQWVEKVMREAELYMHGNYDLVVDEDLEDPKQTKIQFEQPEEADDGEAPSQSGHMDSPFGDDQQDF